MPDAPPVSREARTALYVSLEGLLAQCSSTLTAKMVFRTLQSTMEKMGIQLPPESAVTLAKFEELWSVRDLNAIKSEWPIDLDAGTDASAAEQIPAEPSASVSVSSIDSSRSLTPMWKERGENPFEGRRDELMKAWVSEMAPMHDSEA
jgi:hypothetical protein